MDIIKIKFIKRKASHIKQKYHIYVPKKNVKLAVNRNTIKRQIKHIMQDIKVDSLNNDKSLILLITFIGKYNENDTIFKNIKISLINALKIYLETSQEK